MDAKTKKKLIIIFAAILLVAVLLVAVSEIYIAASKVDMKTEFSEQPRYIAHRGYSSKYFQNTESAYLGAAQTDFFFGIETDIWRTADGVWVCCHDNDPFADKSIKIGDITYQEAQAIELDPTMSGEDLADMSGQYLCTFARYLEICKEYGKNAVIEIKNAESKENLNEMLTIAKAVLPTSQITFISFKKSNIDNLYALDQDLNCIKLAFTGLLAYYDVRTEYNIGVSTTFISQALCDMAASRGKSVNVWGVKTLAEAEKLTAMGADYITTDYVLV